MPKLTIHRSCGNLIYSILNYGAKGKYDEPLKDFVDALRYLRMANGGEGPDHVQGSHMLATTTTRGGY
jgi:hypothetical protein